MAFCKPPCVVLDGVSVGYYPGRPVLKSVSMVLPRGVNVVLGLNGVGKTTLLRTLAGVLKPVEGSIKFYGVDRGKIHYIPHRLGLLPDLTGVEMIRFYSEILGFRVDGERVRGLARELNLDVRLLGKRIGELSNGQQRKLALLIALLHDPTLLLVDEITSGIDVVTIESIHNMFRREAERRIIVMTTHNIYEALELADYIHILYDGRIVFTGHIDELMEKCLGGSGRGGESILQRARAMLDCVVAMVKGGVAG